jgi:dTMP kinase
MASEEDLERLRKDQDSRRQAGRLNQEPTDLKHKSAEEELWEIKEAFKKEQEARMKAEEALMKAEEARMKAEKERDELQFLLAKHEGSVTPRNKGTSSSDRKPLIASRVFRDQLIDIF